MSRIITFSRTYPAYHSMKGCPTNFIEKFIAEEKLHTVRVGRRWKAGEFFSPRVWGTSVNPKSGRSGPYHSQCIKIGPDILITHTYDLLLYKHAQYVGGSDLASRIWFSSERGNQMLYDDNLTLIAKNDGLTLENFKDWILTPIIKGKNDVVPAQIICWSKEVDYDNNPDWLPF